ncbi:hypothetical protein BJF86_03045 [Serinicoccus sp. CNJ-927]|uniref:hypothetical protein n=1 Tax=Serinicoccus sp. CNJ-927 TaxID=1904970 RepID=UPI00095E4E20|nr:hypothetical protein [Serinicoccus sp. CNJ-927]OLT41981.1 hypothetical protein BJF86_03045 [Serinicoccus sp. CNJ-927]
MRRPATVLADRGYTYLTPWGPSIIGQGIEQYLDLHPVQRKTGPGPRPGTIWVDGQLYSDALPERMWELPGYRMGMTSDERAELAARYDEREPYRFTDYGAPEPGTGKVRLRGPAVTGRVRCDNTPSSKRLKRTASRPTTSCRPGRPCGCSVTVVLDPEDGYARTFQRVGFGTTAWQAAYWRRSAVESTNAELRVNRTNLTKWSIRVRGRARVGLMLGFLLGAMNVLMACDWLGTDWADLEAADELPPKFVRRPPRKAAQHRLRPAEPRAG